MFNPCIDFTPQQTRSITNFGHEDVADKLIKLPDQCSIMERLCAFLEYRDYEVYLYPHWILHANQSYSPKVILELIDQGVRCYAEVRPSLYKPTLLQVPRFIYALVEDSKEAAMLVELFWQRYPEMYCGQSYPE